MKDLTRKELAAIRDNPDELPGQNRREVRQKRAKKKPKPRSVWAIPTAFETNRRRH